MGDLVTLILGIAAAYWAIRIPVAVARARGHAWYVTPEHAPEGIEDPPTVSVCIPARNEEAVIANAIGDVLRQDYPSIIEIIVVDDASEDGTAAAITEAAAGDPRVRTLRGDGPPAGWKGKQAAVWRAQAEATGDWLLFVDADVRLHSSAVSVAVDQARTRGAAMLSWLGQLETRSFWEHVLMPFIGDLILLFTKPKWVNDPSRDDCLANGQFILIRRDAYDTVGGHEAVKDSVIDDVSLARVVKFHEPAGSQRYVLLLSQGLMSVRMYDDLAGIQAGFGKNFFAAGKGNVPAMVALCVYLLWMGVLPWVALPVLLALGHGAALHAGIAVGLTLIFRLGMRRFMPHPLWAVLLHPVAALLTTGIVADSTIRGLGWRKPTQWKGRDV